MKNIYLYSNRRSYRTLNFLKNKLIKSGFNIENHFSTKVDIVITVGGDGTFLRLVRELDFPDVTFVGINTGHLGFFQEVSIKDIDKFIKTLASGKYRLHKINPLRVIINGDNKRKFYAVNEASFKNTMGKTMHAGIYIGNEFIERFSGDGIVVSTTSGSTAYNYSCGGAMIDPRVELLQITPISPLNSNAYRCITSGIILPRDAFIKIVPDIRSKKNCSIFIDGYKIDISDFEKMEIFYDIKKTINLMKFGQFRFWSKVKEKFL